LENRRMIFLPFATCHLLDLMFAVGSSKGQRANCKKAKDFLVTIWKAPHDFFAICYLPLARPDVCGGIKQGAKGKLQKNKSLSRHHLESAA
ncbi:MAG: hypothetical protein ONB41_26210, partial [candidate division KSB1 bacterium]|nr:hypothetical protein [candidate division KSB1 bacterium]